MKGAFRRADTLVSLARLPGNPDDAEELDAGRVQSAPVASMSSEQPEVTRRSISMPGKWHMGIISRRSSPKVLATLLLEPDDGKPASKIDCDEVHCIISSDSQPSSVEKIHSNDSRRSSSAPFRRHGAVRLAGIVRARKSS